MTRGFDSERIGVSTFIHLGDPVPGPYLLQVPCIIIRKKENVNYNVK